MRNNTIYSSRGFSLLEAMIAIVLAAIALLGLAAAQARALQFASSSLYSSIAVIQAQNAAERIWPSLCALQQGTQAYDSTFIASLLPEPNLDPTLFEVTLPDAASYQFTIEPTVHAATTEYPIELSWQDARVQDGQDNVLDVAASFPWLRNGGACI